MPLYKKISGNDFEIALWRIEEELAFFQSRFNAHPDIKNENKKLQWYASRYLVNKLLGEKVSMIKDETGKPFIKNHIGNISISHTTGFAAVIFSKKFKVGIDLEMINPKVERIAHKFLRADEINSIKPNEKIEKLILYWSVKESLYKFYGNAGVEFTSQLLIEPFDLNAAGILNAEISTADSSIKNLQIHYDFFDGHVLTYVAGL